MCLLTLYFQWLSNLVFTCESSFTSFTISSESLMTSKATIWTIFLYILLSCGRSCCWTSWQSTKKIPFSVQKLFVILSTFSFQALILFSCCCQEENNMFTIRQDKVSCRLWWFTAKAIWPAFKFKNMVSARLACGSWYMMVLNTHLQCKSQRYTCRGLTLSKILYVIYMGFVTNNIIHVPYEYASVKKWFTIKLI